MNWRLLLSAMPVLLALPVASSQTEEGPIAPPSDALPAARVFGADAAPYDTFGRDVALRGGTLVIGAPGAERASPQSGAIVVYSGDVFAWAPEAVLFPPDGAEDDRFGRTVALDPSGTMVFGFVAGDDIGGLGAGSVRAYERGMTESGTPAWLPTQTLRAPDIETGDGFGHAISTDGQTLVIGVPNDDDRGVNSGAVWVYARYDWAGSEPWIAPIKLHAPDGTLLDAFGWSVAVDGDTLAVGAPDSDHTGVDSGAVYVFQARPGGWVYRRTLLAADTARGDRFGDALALRGNRLVVGAPGADEPGLSASGAAYVFEQEPDGTWIERARLTAGLPQDGGRFGDDLDISGDRIAVAAPMARGFDREDIGLGRVEIFERDPAEGAWARVGAAQQPDPRTTDLFGSAVAIDATTVIGTIPFDPELDLIGSTLVFTAPSLDAVPLRVRVPGDHPTIGEALDAVGFGGEVLLAPGTYHERIVTRDRPVRIAADTEAVVAIAAQSDGAPQIIDPIERNAIIIAGDGSGEPIVSVNARGTGSSIEGVTLSADTPLAGPALRVAGGVALVDTVEVGDNTIATGPAVEVVHTPGTVIRNSRIVRNVSNASKGPGLELINAGVVTVENSLIADNSAALGTAAGIMSRRTDLTIRQSTIAGNEARLTGAAYGIGDASDSVLDIENSVVVGQQGNDVESEGFDSFEVSTTASTRVLSPDPTNVVAADFTASEFFEDPAVGNYAPKIDAPFIDRGIAASVPFGVAIDVLGQPRFHEDRGSSNLAGESSPVVDFGAIEFQGNSSANPCNAADLAEPYEFLNSTDITRFIGAFIARDPLADSAEPHGVFNASDLNTFIAAFFGGCP